MHTPFSSLQSPSAQQPLPNQLNSATKVSAFLHHKPCFAFVKECNYNIFNFIFRKQLYSIC